MELGKPQRNYGIDLLRIVSMFMIVLLHSLGHGGALKGAEPGTWNYRILWLVECAAYCAVNCFALVSGYVGLGSRFRLSGIVQLWLQVFFYHSIFTVTWALLEQRQLGPAALLPVKNNAYWYYTAYFGISFFTPLINTALEHLDRRTMLICAAGIVLLFSVYPTLTGTDMFKLGGGYHVLWLLVIYILGVVLRKYPPFPHRRGWIWAGLYLAAVLLSWGVRTVWNKGMLIAYTSPTIVLAAVSLVMLFSKVNVPGWLRKLIAVVSPLTFGVYLIHDSLFIRSRFIKGALSGVSGSSMAVMGAKVFCFAGGIFVLCLFTDWLRSVLFDKLRVKKCLSALEQKLLK